VRLGLTVLALALLVAFVIVPQLRSAAHETRSLPGIGVGWIAAAVGCEVLSLMAYARLTQVTLHPARLAFGTAFAVDLATFAVSHVVPAGSIVGAGVGLGLFVRAGVEPSRAISGKTVQSIGSAVALNVLLAVALVASVAVHGTSPIYPVAAAIVVGLLVLVGIGVRIVLRHPEGFRDVLGRIGARIPRVGPDPARRLAASLHDTVVQVATHGADRRAAALWAVLNWVLDAAALWCCVRGFGHSLGLVGLFVSYGLANVFAAIPITPGGLGVVEGIVVPALVSFSTPHPEAVFGVTAWRLLSFWAPIPVGFATMLVLRRRHGPDATPPAEPAARREPAAD
jgi:uncharacterized protein (TIRG00374 family)